jgi:hypothetical protein
MAIAFCNSVMSIVTALVVLALGVADTTNATWKASEVVTSYVSGTSPTLILGFDNNLEICLALQKPKIRSAVRDSGISLTDSQLVLLQLWHLVEQTDNGEIRCTVPVIEAPVAKKIEILSGIVADQIIETIGPGIEKYVDTVRTAGWPEGSYTLLGSFVLDGLVWKVLERIGAIESADPSIIASGSDYWSGVAWITLRPQAVILGTNSHRTEDGTLYTAWTPSSLDMQEVLRRKGLREELVAVALGSGKTSIEDSSRLDDLGLVNDGELAVPVILAGSSLCKEGGRLAMRIGRALIATEEIRQIIQLIKARDESVAMIMAYHSVYPAILSRLEAKGLERPPILAGVPGTTLAPSLYVTQDDAACVSVSN